MKHPASKQYERSVRNCSKQTKLLNNRIKKKKNHTVEINSCMLELLHAPGELETQKRSSYKTREKTNTLFLTRQSVINIDRISQKSGVQRRNNKKALHNVLRNVDSGASAQQPKFREVKQNRIGRDILNTSVAK